MLAIHHKEESFSDKWIVYCEKNAIEYKIVDCFATDISTQLSDCTGLMWHWLHYDAAAANFARQLTFSLEHGGLNVFPNAKTAWHYDDKLGQKYLLEAAKLPHVPTYAFYDRETALNWARSTDYPKVFKLRRGAGSMNVMLVDNYRQAARMIRRSFGSGWHDRKSSFVVAERLWQLKRDRTLMSLLKLGHGLTTVVTSPFETKRAVERDYVYFQDFIPGNKGDIRLYVIGDRAFGYKRLLRKGDFKASGSGLHLNDPAEVPEACVDLVYRAAEALESQSLAFDLIFNDGKPLIIEISYSFPESSVEGCQGYWKKDRSWVEGSFTPQWFMVEDFVDQCKG